MLVRVEPGPPAGKSLRGVIDSAVRRNERARRGDQSDECP